MAVALRETEQCIDFFQQTILRTVRKWQQSEAVQQVDVPSLDRNRLTILNIINRGLEHRPSWPELKQLVIAFATYMERRGHWDVWQGTLNGAISVSREVGDMDGEITLTALFARLSQRQGRGDDVVNYYRRAIRLAKRHGNRFEEARACSNLGYYYIDAGHWWRSEVLSCHALGLFEALGNEHGRAHTHNHLGLLYEQQNQLDEAEEHLVLAFQLWDSVNDSHSKINGLINLSQLYLQMERPQDAINQLKEAEQQSLIFGDEAMRAGILMNMGKAYQDLGELEAALSHGLEAEKLYHKFGNEVGLAGVYSNLALVHAEQGNSEEALSLFLRSLGLHRELKDHGGELNLLVNLIDFNLKIDERSEATTYLNQLENLIAKGGFSGYERAIPQMEEYRRNLASSTC